MINKINKTTPRVFPSPTPIMSNFKKAIATSRVAGSVAILVRAALAATMGSCVLTLTAQAGNVSPRRPALQALVFSADPIQSWSRIYHCVFTAAEFRKALNMRAPSDLVGFSAALADMAPDPVPVQGAPLQAPAPAPTPLIAPAPTNAPAIPILAQALPKIASITVPPPAAPAKQAPARRGTPKTAAASAQMVDRPDGSGDDQTDANIRGTLTAGELPDPASPIASYPVSKAKLAAIKAREAKLGLPGAAASAAAQTPTETATKAPKRAGLNASEGTALDPLANRSFDLNSSKTMPPFK
jgi:hypothetical protein